MITWSRYFERFMAVGLEEWKSWIQRNLIAAGQPVITDWTPTSEVKAEVNHGRWIAKCPRCPGAEMVDEWALFVCVSCGFGPAKVAFPSQRKAIEVTLEPRPEENRNWSSETLKELRETNAEHGIPV